MRIFTSRKVRSVYLPPPPPPYLSFFLILGKDLYTVFLSHYLQFTVESDMFHVSEKRLVREKKEKTGDLGARIYLKIYL